MSEDASSNAASASPQNAIHKWAASVVIQDHTQTTFAPAPAAAEDVAGGRGRADIDRSCGIIDRDQLARAFPDREVVEEVQERRWPTIRVGVGYADGVRE